MIAEVALMGPMLPVPMARWKRLPGSSVQGGSRASWQNGEPMEKVNLASVFARISEPWTPKIVGELNGQEVKLAKLEGAFVWHQHDDADELFLVIAGRLVLELEDREPVELGPGELFIVPRGVRHRPVAETGGEVHALLFEPKGTRNTGELVNELTVERPERM